MSSSEVVTAGLSPGEVIGIFTLLLAILFGVLALVAAVSVPIYVSKNGVKRELARIQLNNNLQDISLRRLYQSVGEIHSQILTLWAVSVSLVDSDELRATWPKLDDSLRQYDDEVRLILTELAALVETADGRESAAQVLSSSLGDSGSLEILDYLVASLEGDEKKKMIRYRAYLKNRMKSWNRPS